MSSATYTPLPMNGLRKTEVYSFAEDEWKLRPNLTLNLGVRYTFYNLFHEVHGKADPFDFATCGPQGFCGVGRALASPIRWMSTRASPSLGRPGRSGRQDGGARRVRHLSRRWAAR